jgi:serine/threonine protein phosphatase PrpC
MVFDLRIKIIKGKGPRKEMQDAGCMGSSEDKKFSWLIVCDGIGGYKGGKQAATIAVRVLHNYLKKSLKNRKQINDLSFLEEGIRVIKKKFREEINKDSSLESMGCTLCLIIFSGTMCYFFWSGDTRFYLFRERKCVWETIPHNWTFDLYRKGVLSLDEAKVSETFYLTGSVNDFSPEIRLDCKAIRLQKNDRLLVCTDGIWGLFEHEDLVLAITNQCISKTSILLRKYLSDYAHDNYYGYLVDIIP